MAELVYQTWERITGRPWSEARAGGFTDGSYQANVDLQKRLLGGWDPYAPAPAPAPKPATPKPAAAPTAAAPAASPTEVGVEPGMWLQVQEMLAELDLQRIGIEKATQESAARLEELRLSTTPIDFVAYELYKRQEEAAGRPTYTGPASSDVDIQGMVEAMVGPGAGSLGTGEFGVQVPTTQSVSRAESQQISPQEMGVLSSFLRAGFETPGGKVSYNPEDYWREVEEGFVPTMPQTGITQYRY